MPCRTAQIEAIGPVIEIGISSPADPGNDQPALVVWIRALIDTGCSDTSVHRSVVERCGLQLVGATMIRTGGGAAKFNLYAGDLFLRSSADGPHETLYSDREFAEIVDENPEFDAILGMDILGDGVLIVQGLTHQATFCW